MSIQPADVHDVPHVTGAFMYYKIYFLDLWRRSLRQESMKRNAMLWRMERRFCCLRVRLHIQRYVPYPREEAV